MVRNIAILAAVSVAVLLAIIGLCLSRSRSCDEGAGSWTKSTAKAIPKDTGELLANEESEECLRGFWEIYNAYSNLQSDAMQKHFCAISNKVAFWLLVKRPPPTMIRSTDFNIIEPLPALLMEAMVLLYPTSTSGLYFRIAKKILSGLYQVNIKTVWAQHKTL